MRLLPAAQKFLWLKRYILSQFWRPFEKNVKGTYISGGGCASKTWSFSCACKKFGDAAHPRGRNMVFWNSPFGCVRVHCFISMISGSKFTKLLSPNARGIGIQNVLVQFWISSSLPEIFAAKL